MIKIEHIDIQGWEPAIRGMRNPMNSWDKSDTMFYDYFDEEEFVAYCRDINGQRDSVNPYSIGDEWCDPEINIGPNDHDLMMKLAKAGSEHSKYRRMITVWMDITAPLYWWKEFDTYKVGTVANSCSTMHKIHAKEFELNDFSHDHLTDVGDEIYDTVEEAYSAGAYYADHDYDPYGLTEEEIDGWVESKDASDLLKEIIVCLNAYRDKYLETKDKKYWWQLIQLLPSSYNQKRTVMLNYEALAHIYKQRKDHKLDEWRAFCKMIKTLPYSEIITLEEGKDE